MGSKAGENVSRPDSDDLWWAKSRIDNESLHFLTFQRASCHQSASVSSTAFSAAKYTAQVMHAHKFAVDGHLTVVALAGATPLLASDRANILVRRKQQLKSSAPR